MIRKTISSLSLICTLLIVSCNPGPEPCPPAKEIPIKEHVISSVLWQQTAGEYKALCYQGFNIATARIQNMEFEGEQPLAIITDIDETVLDNSPYSGMQVEKDLDFDKADWKVWGEQESAKALPGAIEFFNLADSLGIEVFYISNRYQVQLEETLNNMRALNLPNADTSHVFLKTETSEKQARRDRVLANHNVILYLGDNLSDFSSVFDGQGTESRNQSVNNLQASFGERFIVFPNPMYGDWETKGIYEGNYKWTPAQKDSIRHSKITAF